ncbi:DUF4097 family beta strand repeat-containing protein [Candidatus Stoquefichus sp. SB1]|uniref:DUF4097 family beta strand repeat-containing protein n=1 Tax=Candidatus Stoquefichus sp. SB1 TaxID=1658109 RepID=UPI00067EAF0B|nr:DUF4097 family beta strand repeat-containing protein [Candidatus Stoquefichus sp. SB1]
MKTIYKVLISFLIGVCLIFAGLSIGGLSELGEVGFLSRLNLRWSASEMSYKDFVASYDIDELSIQIHKGTVQFHQSQDIDRIKITARQVYSGFDIFQKGDKIVIEQPHYWLNRHYESAIIDIYIPEKKDLETVKIDMSAGDLSVHDLVANEVKIDTAAGRLQVNRLECNDLKLNTAMGQTKIKDATVQKKVNVDVGAGDVNLNLRGRQADFHKRVSVGLGHVRVGDSSYSGIADRESYDSDGKIELDIDCGLGNVNVEMEDL